MLRPDTIKAIVIKGLCVTVFANKEYTFNCTSQNEVKKLKDLLHNA